MNNHSTIIKLADKPNITKLKITWNGNFTDGNGKFYSLAIYDNKDLILVELEDDE